jgi:hypothetical protein
MKHLKFFVCDRMKKAQAKACDYTVMYKRMPKPKKTKRIELILLLFISLVFLTVPAHAASGEWGPWDRDRAYTVAREPARQQTPRRNLLSTIAISPGILLISFFQTVVSPVDGASCDFYPTCSAYAKQALAKHGLFIGLAMASERLCRIHAPEGYEPVEKYGNYYYYDPVENNDFWFYTRRAGIP